MNRNDGGHHPHRSAYNRANNKHQYNRQHQQHGNIPASYPPSFSPYQIPPFVTVQPPPLVQQFSVPTFIQQDSPQHHQQQQYFNQPPNHPQQYLPNVSLSHESNQIQNIQAPYNPNITNPNVILNTSSWFGPEIQISNQPSMLPIDQMPPSNPLGQLQLPANQITDTGIIPNAPYYELPAGLMVPLIAPSQREYKPLDPDELRLPLPKFPDENFLRFIDSYYGSDGKTRDNDGWDRAFIDTFIGQKAALAEN